ncbi:MAG: NUDIX domain-containing protein [Firmicutes bacterium]|nr:NUDIX domain-containing protein [Bacillota bacterium]
MEYLQIFDEKKIALDEKIERSLKKTLTNGKHFMIVLLFIQNENKFLIQKTSISKDNIFATTGGHVTYKDSSLETVIKEAKEELNLDLNINDVTFINTFDHSNCFCDVYYTNKKININDIKLQEEEVEDIFWLSEDEILNLIDKNNFRKSNIEAFYEVLKYIKKDEL